jgi:hypothetical protein
MSAGHDYDACFNCGTSVESDDVYWPNCGTSLSGEEVDPADPNREGSANPTPDGDGDYEWFKIGGVVSAFLAILIVPILFGPLAMVDGWYLHRKGERQWGWAIAIGGFVCMALGIALAVLVALGYVGGN